MNIDVTQAATWAPLLAGVAIPFVVAWLTKLHATGFEKSAVAVVTAGLVAVGTYLADVNQSHTWKGLATAFVLALFAAASSRVVVTGGADTALAQKTANFGFGGAVPVNTHRP